MRRTLTAIEEDGSVNFLLTTVAAAASWEWVGGEFLLRNSTGAAFLKWLGCTVETSYWASFLPTP